MNKQWKKEEIYLLAEWCTDKEHFKSPSPSAYRAAIDMEILNKLFGDFTPWIDKTVKAADFAKKQFNETGKSICPATEKRHRIVGVTKEGSGKSHK